MADNPFSVLEPVARLMAGFPAPWYLAGGWALDLFLGRVSRPHDDVDVALLRRDQAALQAHLADWDLLKVIPGERGRLETWRLETWQLGEELALPVHEIHARRPQKPAEMAMPAASPTCDTLELLLNEAEGERWIFRRDPTITRPLALVGRRTPHGLPYLAPEIVLLYKAPQFKPADDRDFDAVAPALDLEQRWWLRTALERYRPAHDWLASL